MLMHSQSTLIQRGFSMIEVLVTIVILAFGLLGLAGFQIHAQTAELESYQRAQALILLDDMVDRMTANRANSGCYVLASGATCATATAATTLTFGTGDTTSCSTTSTLVDRDKCEWTNALKGAAEQKSGTNTGAMIGARGCITKTQDADATPGVCTPETYRVDVVWQGMAPTSAPAVTCGQNAYGNEKNRRAISRLITVGLPGCI